MAKRESRGHDGRSICYDRDRTDGVSSPPSCARSGQAKTRAPPGFYARMNQSRLILFVIFITSNHDRVRAHTARRVNEEIDWEAERRVVRAAGASEAVLSRQIDKLNQEWDMERWLETNASALAFTGTILGLLVNKKFFAIPCLVLPFLFQHAVQGWCPPVPVLRRKGVRTRREIDAERYALKALRGDFDGLSSDQNNGVQRAREAWQAANA
jgi:hypothetical protein